MKLVVNGAEREFALAVGATVTDLIAALGLRPEIVAIEVNGNLVPRATHGACTLAAGDRIECVTMVGGG